MKKASHPLLGFVYAPVRRLHYRKYVAKLERLLCAVLCAVCLDCVRPLGVCLKSAFNYLVVQPSLNLQSPTKFFLLLVSSCARHYSQCFDTFHVKGKHEQEQVLKR